MQSIPIQGLMVLWLWGLGVEGKAFAVEGLAEC